ncbi:MAG: carbon monoxide dehydrogenase subunit G [Rhodospirillales bacterium]|nr:carbon monoxide dehydrogenase subunit G [Rhodospirillales bacterium]
MQMTGEHRIPASREQVWKYLNDPEILRRSIPGCESVERVSDTEMTAKVVLQVGPVKAKFNGKVTLADLDPPNGYTIVGEGQGGVAGFGKGKATIRLESADATTTVLRYTAEATVGGKIAQIGARLIDATAQKLAAEFFDRFVAAVAVPAGEPAAPGVEAAAHATPTGATPANAMSAGRLAPMIWIPALIAVIAILWWWLARG